MRLSHLISKTQREMPAEADTVSHQLMLRAGMIHQVAAGVYAYLPLAWRSIRKIENIIREEMDRAGGQELLMPALQPLELWQATGRAQAFGKNLFTFLDRKERWMCLAPTHEEVITQIASRNIQSYRDLPILAYHISLKFRDEPRPKGGLLRVREFTMKDLYSFDADDDGLDVSYNKMLHAYRNIYSRCGLPAICVEADSGAIGGKDSHEFMILAESGEDEVIHCNDCDYAANMDKAQSTKEKLPEEKPLPIEEVATPGVTTIEGLSKLLKVPANHTLKVVFYKADDEFVIAVIRGDIEINETKLKNILHCSELRLTREEEVSNAGIIAGSASPIGIIGIRIIADDSITSGTNFVAGANKPDTHLKNVNYPRDFQVEMVTDIARAEAGEGCPRCEGELSIAHGLEVGHVFKLGTFLSEALGAYFIDAEGVSHPIIMGCYGIGSGRLLAAVIEYSHDDKGIIWPMLIAPYHIYLCPLHLENTQVATVAEKLYTDLTDQGFEVLFDDRNDSPGIKFNDADLLGIPIRVTISRRTLEANSVEIKKRSEENIQLVPVAEAEEKLRKLLSTRS
ncbi:proline--tRNA ligase [Chloroflexota bacterium]